MRFEEGINQLDYVGENTPISLRNQFTDKEGNCDEIALELECYRVWAAEVFRVLEKLQETYETENQEVLKLKNQIEISKDYFKNILEVNPNIRIGSPSHLANCVNVMKISAENALKRLEEVE